ncbi:L-cystine import ATP-binding protein TcyN [compost metagenome]
MHLLERLGLEYLDLTKNAADLSGGEKQRISLIRSLLLHPEVLLLDEVTASLDRGSKQRVEELLLEWHVQEGTTMIWVTHDLEQAKHISRTIWFMGEGTLLESCPTDVFFTHPSTETARCFIQGQAVEQLLHIPNESINEVSSCP